MLSMQASVYSASPSYNFHVSSKNAVVSEYFFRPLEDQNADSRFIQHRKFPGAPRLGRNPSCLQKIPTLPADERKKFWESDT